MTALAVDRLAVALLGQTEGLGELARGAELDRQVPSCPEWDLRGLLVHVGQGHRFAADVVLRRASEPTGVIVPSTIPPPEDAAELPQWLTDGAQELIDTVQTVGSEQPVWNFTGQNQHAGFWLRRMVHDTAAHRGDAALTVDAPFQLDAELAADGISEWLALLTSPGAAAARPQVAEALRGRGQTLHLHATDTVESGEWLIERGPDGVTWQQAHEKADVAVRGRAGDLLLALLGRIRPDDERLTVFGDAALFEHWQRHVTV